MATHRLHIGDLDEIDFQLFAIHTHLEDYRLAYFINQKLQVLFSKSDDIQLTLKTGAAAFSKFDYESHQQSSIWNLFQNKNVEASAGSDNSQNLFAFTSTDVETTMYLLPEFKKVDFFLKVENAFETPEEILAKVHTISQVSTAYLIETNKIKSKNNLIF